MYEDKISGERYSLAHLYGRRAKMFGLAQVDRLNGDVCIFTPDITHAYEWLRSTDYSYILWLEAWSAKRPRSHGATVRSERRNESSRGTDNQLDYL